jgi:hypothetical protein
LNLRTYVNRPAEDRPGPLQPTEATLRLGMLVSQHGISLPPDSPLLHFARLQDMVNRPPARDLH